MTRALPLAVSFVLLVTGLRIAALWFDQTDLFVDEAQYWLWGQNPDFGYFSKPPLIAWVIRLVTELAGSIDAFWVRMPAPLFHAATAMILFFATRHRFDPRAAFWVAVTYITLPMTALGSYMISTDTIMIPFFALGLWAYMTALDSGKTQHAALAGLAIGIGFMAKYAAVYFLMSAGLAAIFMPQARPNLKQVVAFLIAFAMVISPNIIWNIQNDLTTVSHTMENVQWVQDEVGISLNFIGLAEFFFSQFLVFGPILFATLILAICRPFYPDYRLLAWYVWPIIALVLVQALLARAYANWAVAAYVAGTILVVMWLLDRRDIWLKISLIINSLIAVIVPILIVIGPTATVNGKPVLTRYLGRADLSQQIIAMSRETKTPIIVANHRDILADLFHSGYQQDLSIYAAPFAGAPHNYYEQNFALPNDAGMVLFVAETPPKCGIPDPAMREFSTDGGAYAGRKITGTIVPATCLQLP